jgi:hypothetical protein
LYFALAVDIYKRMNIRTELIEALIRQCVREVLDQVDEDTDKKPIDKSSGIGKGGEPKKIKPKWSPPTKFKVGIKKTGKLNEEEDPKPEEPKDKQEEPAAPPTGGSQPEPSKPEEPKGEEPKVSAKPEEPKPEIETPPAAVKGAAFINPKDKSRLQPVRLQGRNDNEIERALHQLATSVAGARTKVSLGAKRMGREVAKNPNTSVYFYLGKMDPESDEIFLMADKSLNIAKDDSVQPGEITGTPVSVAPAHNYQVGKWDEPQGEINPDNKYADWMSRGKITPTAKPRYGIDEPELNESAKSLVKRMVNQILDGRK